jgi:hypothetical protein
MNRAWLVIVVSLDIVSMISQHAQALHGGPPGHEKCRAIEVTFQGWLFPVKQEAERLLTVT